MTIISFILVLGFLILIHEMGHFLVAKMLDVKVEKFSIGFGPKLLAFTKGETEYMISAFPLGGYVKLLGEGPEEELKNDPREFASRPVSHRMAIIIAGPIMNLMLTFLLFPLVFMIGVNLPAYLDKEVRAGWVMEDSPAKEAGIESGDLIVAVDGKSVETWDKALTLFATNPDNKITLDVIRNGNRLNIEMTPRMMKDGGGYAGILQPMKPVIGGLSPDMPGARAGLMKGDTVVSVDGNRVTHWVEMSYLIRESKGKELALGVMRGEEYIERKLTPVMDEAAKKAVIGISYKEEFVFKKYGFVDSVKAGSQRALDLTWLTLDIMKRLFTLDINIKSLGGPIMIAQATGAASQEGLSAVIALMAFISLQLGILNLLPIPVLDGGHVFFLLTELVLRKPLSMKTREIAQQIGFIMLILLMLIVSYNDIMRVFPF